VGVNGADGYALLGWNGSTDVTALPSGTTLTLDRGSRYTWTASTTSARALTSPDQSTRKATTIADDNQVRLHLTFQNAYAGSLKVYAYDWDSTSRRESVVVNDGSGPRTADLASDFSQGVWITAPVNVPAGGVVTITVTSNNSSPPVISGVFLG
jgi:hypothetical protein